MTGNESARAGKNYDYDDKFHLNDNSNHRKPKITVHYHKLYRLKALPLHPPQNVAPEDGVVYKTPHYSHFILSVLFKELPNS